MRWYLCCPSLPNVRCATFTSTEADLPVVVLHLFLLTPVTIPIVYRLLHTPSASFRLCSAAPSTPATTGSFFDMCMILLQLLTAQCLSPIIEPSMEQAINVNNCTEAIRGPRFGYMGSRSHQAKPRTGPRSRHEASERARPTKDLPIRSMCMDFGLTPHASMYVSCYPSSDAYLADRSLGFQKNQLIGPSPKRGGERRRSYSLCC